MVRRLIFCLNSAAHLSLSGGSDFFHLLKNGESDLQRTTRINMKYCNFLSSSTLLILSPFYVPPETSACFRSCFICWDENARRPWPKEQPSPNQVPPQKTGGTLQWFACRSHVSCVSGPWESQLWQLEANRAVHPRAPWVSLSGWLAPQQHDATWNHPIFHGDFLWG